MFYRFHLCQKVNIPLRRIIELWWLGILIKKGVKYCNFASAESRFSLQLLSLENNTKSTVSVNGSDRKLRLISRSCSGTVTKDVAVIIGTYHHKNLIDSYKIYSYLKLNNSDLKLIIFGDIDTVPLAIKDDPQVELKGSIVDHEEIINVLSQSRFYINTSEN